MFSYSVSSGVSIGIFVNRGPGSKKIGEKFRNIYGQSHMKGETR